jgi:outer membrane protein insertion porin family
MWTAFACLIFSLSANAQQTSSTAPATTDLWTWAGQNVSSIDFTGVTFTGDPLLKTLPQTAGQPLSPEKLRQSIRRLYASGLYRNLQVNGTRDAAGIHLTFTGVPRFFIGTVEVTGVRDDHLNSLLVHASHLDPGTPFSEPAVADAVSSITSALEQNGYHKSSVTYSTRPAPDNLRNIAFHVITGAQARIGQVTLTGDAGLDLAQLRRRARIFSKTHADHDTITRALSRLRTYYQKDAHLEAVITLESQTFQPPTNTVNLGFHSEQGPQVYVLTEGVHINGGRLHRLIPIYEEGAVDDDLLNEGARNLRDDMQREGFFDAKVSVKTARPDAKHETVTYTIDRGEKHKVSSIDFMGNKAFTSEVLLEHMHMKPANVFLRSGLFSQQLLASDITNIQALYHASGYTSVQVTSSVDDVEGRVLMDTTHEGILHVHIKINEGPQQHYGNVTLTAASSADPIDPTRATLLHALIKSKPGDAFSLATLSADHDAIAAFYQKRGFAQAEVELQQTEDASTNLTGIHFIVMEGPQTFINQVLITGLHYTRPSVVNKALRIHPGDALDQDSLINSQHNLYDLTLFNEVNLAVENPAGDTPQKNVLVQLTEAKRWDFIYGIGFEAETGEPSVNCPNAASLTLLGINPSTFVCSPQGSTGASERVSLDITRNGLFGRDQSCTNGGADG